MGKVINYLEVELDAVPTQAKDAPCVVRGEAAEQLHFILTKPAEEPTPRMKQAIRNYNRLMAMKRSSADDANS